MGVAGLVVHGVTFVMVSNGSSVGVVLVLGLLVVCGSGAVCDSLVRVGTKVTLGVTVLEVVLSG